MDRETRNITISKSIVFFVAVIASLSLFFKYEPKNIAGDILITFGTIIIASTYLVLFLLSPTDYVLTDNALIIKRFIGNVKVELKEIQTINIINTDFLRSTYTTIRNSGLFGYTGSCLIKNVNTELFIKRKKENVLITRFGKSNIIISPDDIILVIDLSQAVQNRKSRGLING